MKIVEWFRKSDLRSFILSLVLFVMAMLLLLPLMSKYTILLSGTTHFPDSDFWYTASDLKQMSSYYDFNGGLGFAFTRFTFDLVWPAIYFYFLYSSMRLITKSTKSKITRKSYTLLPFLAVMFDLLENTLCSAYFMGLRLEIVAVLASISSALKWVSIFAAFTIILIYLLLVLFNRIKRITSKKTYSSE